MKGVRLNDKVTKRHPDVNKKDHKTGSFWLGGIY